MRVFIAGRLLDAEGIDLDFYTTVGTICRDAGFDDFVPHLRIEQAVGDEQIFREDMEGLRSSGLVIAEVSAPSHGVGGELMLAYLENIPVICIAARGKKVSAMVRGNPAVKKTIEYDSPDDCIRELKLHLQSLQIR